MFDGKSLNAIYQNGNQMELWVTGGMVIVTVPEDIRLIMKLLQQGKKLQKEYDIDINSYVRYELMEHYDW
jgi:hypothetical protein